MNKKSPLPGIWRVRGHGAIVPSAIIAALRRGDELLDSERALLATVLERLEAAETNTRRKLGITASRSRTAERDLKAAAEFLRQRAAGKGYRLALAAATAKYGAAARHAVESGETLARARGLILAEALNQRDLAVVARALGQAQHIGRGRR